MIGYIEGNILRKSAKTLIVKNQGIGYLVYVPVNLFEKVEPNQKIELYIYTKVREDDISLYGFEKTEDLEFFKDLIGVNGIGPKLALEILSTHISKTKNAILQENIQYLSKIPGIGKKTAERIIVELKNKLTPENLLESEFTEEKNFDDVLAALSNLGYQRFEILKTLKNLPENIKETEEIITYFIKNA